MITKRPFFFSIRVKFCLLVIFLIAIVVMAITFYDSIRLKTLVRQEMESKARMVAASLSLAGTEVVIDNLYLIQGSLAGFSRLPDVSQIFFIDDSGMITAANDVSRIGDILTNDPLFQLAVSKKMETVEYYVNKEGVHVMAIFEPMFLNGKINSWIQLDLSLKNMEEKYRTYRFEMILLALICTIIGVLLTLAISQKISDTLNLLVTKFKKLAGGDFTEKLFIHSRDELEEVASSYNTLVDQMSSMVSRLEKKQEQTEEKRKVAEERLNDLANYDSLTHLPNRSLFIDRLIQVIAQAKRNQKRLAILFLDLDGFKLINDTQGHHVGDFLLLEISKILKSGRETDTVARFGGDEFTVELTNISNVRDAAVVSEKLLNAVSRHPFKVANHEIFVTASIGIALYPDDGEDYETLLKNADTAMDRARERGRNTFQFYSADMNRMALARFKLETGLRRALEREEFVLHYQPIVDLHTGKMIGAEALLRWKPKDSALVSPAEFIPVAEETGLILPIGEWALRTACVQNQDWQREGLPPIKIAVNLSVHQFREHHFLEVIQRILKETGLSPNFLELEITESHLMQNIDRTTETLTQLAQMGIQISIDDFGTGYSSLSYLRHLSIDTLKIDRSFVKDITENPDDQAIVSAIIAMAHRLKLKVVAEGVETENQLAFLRDQKCDSMQGYLFCRPVPADEFKELLLSKKFMNLS
ncbi:MAG: EAL domain-containing protein [Nitrospirae bacterium]|nr:EAL domain-containing protein [Nitrospirota bacterium]